MNDVATSAGVRDARLLWRDHGLVPSCAPVPLAACRGELDGAPRLWTVLNGQVAGTRATLVCIDPVAAVAVSHLPLEGAGGAWGVHQAADGAVFASCFHHQSRTRGGLYRWDPRTSEVEDLGTPTGRSAYLWQCSTADDGTVFTGTFEGAGGVPGHLGSWSRQRGWSDLGTLDEAPYVRATCWTPDAVYAGTGPVDGGLYRLGLTDTDAGAAQRIPPPPGVVTPAFCYAIDPIEGMADLLVIQFTSPAGDHHGWVFRCSTESWVAELGPLTATRTLVADPDGTVLFARRDGLFRWSPTESAPVRFSPWPTGASGLLTVQAGSARAGRFGTESTWVGLTSDADLLDLDSAGHATLRRVTGLVGNPSVVMGTGSGPHGAVMVGAGFRNFAGFDPTRRAWRSYASRDQVQTFVPLGDSVVLGTYPGAEIRRWDPGTVPGHPGDETRLIRSQTGDHQDRPFAQLMLPDGEIATGTVPKAGQTGGLLAVDNLKAGSHRTLALPVPEHGVTALALHGDRLVVGTAAYGGVGAAPIAGPGHVVCLDPLDGSTSWDQQAPHGAKAVTSLAVGRDGLVWAASLQLVFALDPADGRVVATHELAAVSWDEIAQYWSGSRAIPDPETGLLHITTDGMYLLYDPQCRQVLHRHDDREHLVLHPVHGAFCTSADTHLWQAPRVADVVGPVAPPHPSPSPTLDRETAP